ncbi:uncharacterized protein BDZ99DRAFT_542490 [Mytilinidion resinicola]|uniref:Nucleoporin NUP49/NSP49 n=1 Tax=Mytilinidion resinicola TaxID=574789 RepID=A0A6A6Z694_9PEZI|nr:uncharacterized protein BDZ99DRAFT_542490 [Mytilinidion resinicola]KAF2816193.1 hypothetical protein BDZ99DRAFT_542490 [Mytilinidion resinicola]
MAGFGRSNSLSINTGSSLFAGLFGASTNASQPQQTGGLFGQATSQPQSGGLFGQSATAQPQQSGGLFGNLQKPAQQQTGSLFGQSTAQSQPQQQQAGSLLGGNLGQQNQNQPQSGGLFGNLGQQKPATPSLFGSTQAKPSPSLFGASLQQPQQQQTQQQPSLFGGMAPQNTQTNTLGGGLGQFGQSQTQPTASFSQHTGAGLGIEDATRIRGTTQFTDLKVALQNEIATIEQSIQDHITWARKNTESLAAHGAHVAQLPPDVAYVQEKFKTMELAMDNDVVALDHVKQTQKKDEQDVQLLQRAIQNMALPQHYHYASMRGLNAANASISAAAAAGDDDDQYGKPVDLVAYFSQRGEVLDATLTQYNKQIREIEAHLRTVESGAVQRERELMAQAQGGSPRGNEKQELFDALKAIEGAIFQVASKVGTAREMVVKETLGAVGT